MHETPATGGRAAHSLCCVGCVQVLVPFPELAPLVAVMAWDLQGGSVGARQEGLQRLWHQRTRSARPGHTQVRPFRGDRDRDPPNSLLLNRKHSRPDSSFNDDLEQ